MRSLLSRPPGPHGYAAARAMLALRRDPLSTLQSAVTTYGHTLRFPLGHRTFVLVAHPDGVRHVLQDAAERYSKRTRTYRKVAMLVGDGLLTSNGNLWRDQRRAAQPAFHRQHIATLDQVIFDATGRMIGRWREAADRGTPINAGHEMTRLTLEILVRAFLGACTSEDAARLARDVDVAVQQVTSRVEAIFDPGPWWPAGGSGRFRQAVRALDEEVASLVAASGEQNGDGLIDRLRRATSGPPGTAERLVRDQVMTFLLAGHETTANALTWTLSLIASHPHVGDRLAEEATSILGDRLPTSDNLPTLPLTRAVFLEALRLYPPVWLFERRAEVGDEVCGHRIPAGTGVAISPYVTHRHPDFWESPELFMPERFLPSGTPEVPRFGYFPFGGSARHCIGDHFAMMEGQLVLATIMRAFHTRPVHGERIVPRAGVTLRPARPVCLELLLR